MDNSFITAIDNHNIANGDTSWFDKKAAATGELITDIAQGVAYGLPSAVVAGINSLINTGVAVTNFVGGDTKEVDTYQLIKGFDEDLAKYYVQHKEGIEIAGFIGASFIPGMAGIKALNAAKAGFMGQNMAKSSGLMQTITRDYAALAKADFATGTPFSILNQNVIKGLGQGFGSAALEMVAFETAVAATMFKNPILEEQSIGDMLGNILTGTLIGGGLGGVIHGVGLVYGVKKAGVKIDRELFPYRLIPEVDDIATSEMKLINYYEQKLNMPEAKLAEGIVTDLDPASRLKLISVERQKTLEVIDSKLKQTWNDFTGQDNILAQQLFDVFKDITKVDDVRTALMHAKGAKRITANESVRYGDTLFLVHGGTTEGFELLKKGGDLDLLFTPRGTEGAKGYKVVGDLSNLKVTGAGIAAEDGVAFGSKEAAFNAKYDMYRNSNGAISINPESTIIKSAEFRRNQNNFIIDLENKGGIIHTATPGLNDLATPTKPVRVSGNVVMTGKLKPISVGTSSKFDPVKMDYTDVQARYVWAKAQKEIFWKNKVVSENDLPMLERAYEDGSKASEYIIKLDDGKSVRGPTEEMLRNLIEHKKAKFAADLNGKPLDEIAIRLNVDEKWLSGESGEWMKYKLGSDWNKPRYARVDFADNLDAMETLNANSLGGAIAYEQQKLMIRNKVNHDFANFARDDADHFLDAPNWTEPGRAPTRMGAGASLFGFANANLGTAGGFAQYTGPQTNALKLKRKTASAKELNAGITTVAAKGDDAIAEISLLTNKLRASPDLWGFDITNPTQLIKKADWHRIQTKKLTKPTETIELSPEAIEFGMTHGRLVQERQPHVSNMKAGAGVMDSAPQDAGFIPWYAPPINTEKLKHFVFVEPRGLNLEGQKRVIAAKDEATLNRLIQQVDQNEFRIRTKAEMELDHNIKGDYDFSLGMNESRVDSELSRKGVLSQMLPTTSSKEILDEYMQWHMRQEDVLVTRMVNHKYSQAFKELETLGDRHTNIATSQFRSLTERLEQSVKDPYKDVIKTALDISRASEYQWWRTFNDTVQNAIEGPINKLREIFRDTKQIDDTFVDRVNKTSNDLGLGTPFKDATAAMVANGNIASKPWLASGIAKAQSILSTTLLQWDHFNAINNLVSSHILLSSESQFIIKAIMSGDAEVAGKLSGLMKVKLPDGSGIEIPAINKLVKKAYENYRADHIGDGSILKRFTDIKVIIDETLYHERQMLNNLQFNFSETASQFDKKIQTAHEFGRKWTGNKLTENMTRFVAADVMRQITDLAIESGVLKNIKEANEYIQLFVNKTQGNYLHSQRPIVFQGVVGQAVSLFQTYQFNLMQQLFKYVGEGDKKSLAMLLGLQGGIYGMQGLPAFNFLNTHIVGNASGNTEHKDLYYASYSVFGKQLGDWMMYGAGSNALQLIDSQARVNLYSRGDINPRQITVLPTSIEDIPVVSASVRMVKNIWQVGERLADGGAFWATMSQAIEHNGFSRPLSGLAAVAQGYTTTNQASLLTASQDFYNIATVSRVMGGKPFDEAVALDALYRINAYKAKDASKIQELGSAIKTSVVGNKTPSAESMEAFAKEYAKSGGRIENFNRFYTNTMMGANRSQVNKIAENLNTSFSKQLQIIMGGNPLPDYANTLAKE